MQMLDYIPSYDEVRALLGVNDEELADRTIGLRVYVLSFEESLNELDESMSKSSGALRSQFDTVRKIAQASRTAVQQRFFDNVQSYATYHVADDLVSTLPQFSPKTITDGKAMVMRHADAPYQKVIEGVRAGKARAVGRLKRAYQGQLGEAVTTSVVTPASPLRVSTLGVDPVTGS